MVTSLKPARQTRPHLVRGAAILLAMAVAVLALTACKDKQCSSAPAPGGTTGSVDVRSAAASVPDAPGGRAPNPKPDKNKSKKPCPPNNSGKKDNKMFGANGPRIFSHTVHRGHVHGYRYRIDIENPAPGKRPASMHVQLGGRGSTHYEYNPRTRKFVTRGGEPLPRAVQDHLDTDPVARRKIKEGLRKLGEA